MTRAGRQRDAVYSNLGTFRNSRSPGRRPRQFLNTITRLAADDLNLVGSPPYAVNGFRFIVTNLNAVDVSARPLVRFHPHGPGGGPGTLIEARTYNPTCFTPASWAPSTAHVRPSTRTSGPARSTTTVARPARRPPARQPGPGHLLAPGLGTSTDRYFVTTAAGSFASDNPAARS
jgi:hypothetical protein